SDDIMWAKRNVSIPFPLTFIDHNGEERDYEDLRLMSNCRHHIIANSSFSWWGAWLGNTPHGVVIAPRKWFSDEEMAQRKYMDIVPGDWMEI
ncbi:MAG: alpha-1,2-fucosyltransferase, partial [bacterium]